MDTIELGRHLRAAWVGKHPDAALESTSVTSVLNWGGFVNRSFDLVDRGRQYHVKLTSGARRTALERWRTLAEHLTTRHRAPEVLEWIEVPGTGFGGLVFPKIPGQPPNTLSGSLLDDVVSVIAGLHGDRQLAEELETLGDSVGTCVDVYARTYHDRFTENIVLIHPTLPPFLDAGGFEWLRSEVLALHAAVRESAAFNEPADAPTHQDLWLDNLLVQPDGAWHLLDWDDVALGDPALDWAGLLGPSRHDVLPMGPEQLELLALEGAEKERVAMLAQAALLDWVLDPLADWIEAGREPEHGATIRESSQRIHLEAIGQYRRLYGGRQ